jgi:hypothetical protein
VKAFILDDNGTVQIGNKIFHTTSGRTENSTARRAGIFRECKCYVEVPFKSMEGANLAIVMAQRKSQNRKTL